MLGWLGLRTRLVLLVLLALLPVFGLLVYSAEQSYKAALRLAQSDLQSDVLMLSAREQRTVDMVRDLLTGIASSPHIKNPAPGLCDQHLKNLHGGDEKLICVPIDTTFPYYADVGERQDLPSIVLQQIEHFFTHYKDLEADKWVRVGKWGDAADARRIVLEAIDRAKEKVAAQA